MFEKLLTVAKRKEKCHVLDKYLLTYSTIYQSGGLEQKISSQSFGFTSVPHVDIGDNNRTQQDHCKE